MSSVPPHAARILLIDDEPGLRQTLGILFRREGYEVTALPGARSAREAISQSPRPFAIVLTDLLMPDGSGMDVLVAAKERDPATQVIVMTAHSTIEAAVE